MACTPTVQTEPNPPSVKVVEVDTVYEQSRRSYTFISQPYRVTELSFRVGGPVHLLDVQSGQFFRKGELIAAIDNRDFVVRKQRAEAIYRQAEADYKRVANLYAKDNISGMNYEKAKADYEKAKADYEDAVNELQDTRLYAPFDGYVQQVHIDCFQDVKPASPVVTFIDLSKIKIEAYVPEDMAIHFSSQLKDSCRVHFDTQQGQTFIPTEMFLTQSTSQNNISYLLTVLLDNHDGNLFGGMSGSIEIPYPSSVFDVASITIPQTAVCHHTDKGTFVWQVDKQNQVCMVPIKLGKLRRNDSVEVLSGLSAGDRIATTHLSYLSEHEKITIQQ